MKANIHPTAFVEAGAKIADGAIVGAYCIVGKDVKIGAGTELKSHVVIDGDTTLGKDNVIYPFVSLGQAPQDKKFKKGEKTKLVIGNNNQIREYTTINLGTVQDNSLTKIGDNNLIMAYSHVAHDCIIGNNCVLANAATLGGHVEIDDFAIIGGMSAIHQFVRIGKHCIVGGKSAVDKDVPHYASVLGNRATLQGLNLVGLRRRDFSRESIKSLKLAYEYIFVSEEGDLAKRVAKAKKEFKDCKEVQEVIKFIKDTSRGIISRGERLNG